MIDTVPITRQRFGLITHLLQDPTYSSHKEQEITNSLPSEY